MSPGVTVLRRQLLNPDGEAATRMNGTRKPCQGAAMAFRIARPEHDVIRAECRLTTNTFFVGSPASGVNPIAATTNGCQPLSGYVLRFAQVHPGDAA